MPQLDTAHPETHTANHSAFAPDPVASFFASNWLLRNCLFLGVVHTCSYSPSAAPFSVALLDKNGEVLYSSLIQSPAAFSASVLDTYGVSRADITNAPHLNDVSTHLSSIAGSRPVVCHDAIRAARSFPHFAPGEWCGIQLILDDLFAAHPLSIQDALRAVGEDLPTCAAPRKAIYDAECCRRILVALDRTDGV